MLRDPVARVVSMYGFIRGNPKHWLHDELVRSGMGLREFVETAADPGVDNEQTRLIAGIGSGELGQPPSPLGSDALEQAKRNLRTFLVVGLTERFDDSFILLRRALGWRLPMYMSVNAARSAEGAPVDEGAVAAIRKRNRFDLELYDFARGIVRGGRCAARLLVSPRARRLPGAQSDPRHARAANAAAPATAGQAPPALITRRRTAPAGGSARCKGSGARTT